MVFLISPFSFLLSPLFQQIWAQALRALQGLLQLPFLNLCFMPREEHVGHTPAFVFRRAGVNGCGKEVVLEGVRKGALLVANNARDEAHDAVRHHRRRQFATRQDIVADGHFLRYQVLTNAVIHTLVVATKDDDVLLHRECVGHGLVELLTVGRGEDYLIVLTLRLERRNAIVDGLALHHHARKAAKRIVVHTAVLVLRVIAEVVNVNLHKSLLLGATKDGEVHKVVQHLGHNGDDIDTHSYSINRKVLKIFTCKNTHYLWDFRNFV